MISTHAKFNQEKFMEHPNPIRMMVYTALFIALIIVGAYIAVPIGPVPIVLQNMFVLLAAIILGPRWGLGCVAVYLLLGIMGLPVFAGGMSGIGRIFGPTGGYLIGYLPAVFVCAVMSKGLKHSLWGNLLALLTGSLLVYAIGVPWLKIAYAMSWAKALAAGMLPFLIGDTLKMIAAAFIAKSLTPVLHFQERPYAQSDH